MSAWLLCHVALVFRSFSGSGEAGILGGRHRCAVKYSKAHRHPPLEWSRVHTSGAGAHARDVVDTSGVYTCHTRRPGRPGDDVFFLFYETKTPEGSKPLGPLHCPCQLQYWPRVRSCGGLHLRCAFRQSGRKVVIRELRKGTPSIASDAPRREEGKSSYQNLRGM
jgi:hypothetical protein